MTTYIYKLW